MIDSVKFQEKQNEIIKKRENYELKKLHDKNEQEKKENEENKEKIEEFYNHNREILIDETLDAFMTKLNNEDFPPYKVEYKFNLDSYMGFNILVSKPNSSSIYFENMIKNELRKKIGTIGKINVFSQMLNEEDGYWSRCQWFSKGYHPLMYVKISLTF